MAEAGCRLHTDLTALAVMCLTRALELPRCIMRPPGPDSISKSIARHAVVLCDSGMIVDPEANRRAYTLLHAKSVWPHGGSRNARRLFEVRRGSGNGAATPPFVGHPFFDEVRRYNLDSAVLDELEKSSGPLVRYDHGRALDSGSDP